MAELKMAPVGDARQGDHTRTGDVNKDKREEWTKRWNREVER